VPSRTVGTVLMIDDNERAAQCRFQVAEDTRISRARGRLWGNACNHSPLILKFKTCDGLLAFAGPSKSTYGKGKSFEVNNIFYRLRRGR